MFGQTSGKISGKVADADGNPLQGANIIVEAVGGIDTTRQWLETALKNGANVVTANKQVIAEHGINLLALAQKNNLKLHSRNSQIHRRQSWINRTIHK